MIDGMSEKQISAHSRPLWSGNLIIEKVGGHWLPGGLSHRLTDRQRFAYEYGSNARQLKEKFGHIEDHPQGRTWVIA